MKTKNIFENNLHKIFVVLLLFTTALSFYFFIHVVVLKEYNHQSIFSNWQFPMLLAVFLDVLYETQSSS